MYTELLIISQLMIGDNLTTSQVSNNQLNQIVSIDSQNDKNQGRKKSLTGKGNFRDMLEALGERETGLKSGNPEQYKFVNRDLYFLGKYQFAEILLVRLGYYKAEVYYGNGSNTNLWKGTWTGKKGIKNKNQFLNSPQVQETAIREAFGVYWQDINYLMGKKGKSIESYLGQTKTFGRRKVKITLSGAIAAAHLKGSDKLVDLLVNNKVSQDPFGTSILDYLEEFGGYKVTPEDFITQR